MQEGVLRVAIRPEDGTGTKDHYLRRKTAIEGKEVGFELVEKEVPELDDAISSLVKAEADLILMSGKEWANIEEKAGLAIAAVFPRREPTWVLISDDKPEYLPRRAIIVCPNPMIRRQMRRARRDCQVISLEKAAELFGVPKDEDVSSVVPWLHNLLVEDSIDAFIINRSRWELAGIRNRRHTLGLQRNQRDRAHFIPPTFSGFSLLVCRSGFPIERVKIMHDKVSESSLKIEYFLWQELEPRLKELVAIHSEQRGVGPILRDAEVNEDLPIRESLLDTDGRVINGGTRVEIRMEMISKDGLRTIAQERTAPLEFSYEESVKMKLEWNNLVEVSSEDFVDPNNPQQKTRFFVIE